MKKILLALMMIATMAIGQTSPTGVEAYTHPVMDLVPIAPTSLVATAGVGTVSLTWNASLDIYGDTISDLLRYNIQRKTGVGGTWATMTTDPTTITTTSYTDGQVSASNAYYYRVSVTDIGGNTSTYSNESNATPTTDSTAPTVPSSFAGTANGTAITVTWAASTDIGGSGVENYRGYRSLAADFSNPTSFITSGLSFAHSGLAQNTLYYYRVQAKDYAGNYSEYAYTQVTSGVISGDPVVSGVSGTLTNTSLITVSGSSFGSRPVTQQIYDDMEGSTFNTSWSSTGSQSSSGERMIQVAAGVNARHQFSQKNTSANFIGTNNLGHASFAGGSNRSQWFCQYWFKLDNDWDWGLNPTNDIPENNAPDFHLSNVKIFRLWSTGSSYEDFAISAHGNRNGVLVIGENLGPDESIYVESGFLTSQNWAKNVWHCMQVEFRECSAVNVADGYVRWWLDGRLAFSDNARVTRSVFSETKRPYGIGFYNSGGDSGSDSDHVYFDDAFMSDTFARVEIGTTPIYDSTTVINKRELQPTIIQWTDNQIQFSMNQGALLTGQQAYLYVVNSNGVKSVGYPITIGAGASTTPAITPPSAPLYNGNNFTITGSGFGTKSPATPILWDNFENGTSGANITTSPNAWVPYGDNTLTFNTTTPYSGTRSISSIETLETSGEVNSANFFFPATETIYYSYMTRIVSTGDPTGQFKSGRSNSSPNLYNGAGAAVISDDLAGYDPGTGYVWLSNEFYNESTTWKRHQLYKKNSTAGVANGEAWFSIGNNEMFVSSKPAITRAAGQTWGGQTNIILGTMFTGARSGSSHQIWVDDVYVDRTQARVELGDAATFDACSHREIQIPTQWSPTGITFTVNRGTFPANSSAWLYVVNSDGTVSTGVQVTLDPVYTSPTILGVSDSSPTNDQEITITGGGWGSVGPNVVMFDDFEGGTDGASINTSGVNGPKVGTWTLGWSPLMHYSNTSPRGSMSAFTDASDGSRWYTRLIAKFAQTREIYVSYWFQVPPGSVRPSSTGNNWKTVWILGNDPTTCEQLYNQGDKTLVNDAGSSVWRIAGNDQRLSGQLPSSDNPSINYDFTNGYWYRNSWYMKANTTSAAPHNGIFDLKAMEERVGAALSNQRTHDILNITNAGLLSPQNGCDGSWTEVNFNGNVGQSSPNEGAEWDDCYIAIGSGCRARVEIGNASTYANCTNLTICVPSSWSSSSITSKIYTGSFTTGSAWLFVVDQNGTASAGYPITIQ